MKRYLLVFSLLCLSLLICACGGQGNVPLQQPPVLRIVTDCGSYTALLGTYSWTLEAPDGNAAGIESDSAHPLCRLDEMELIPVCSGRFSLCFDTAPDEISLRFWDDQYAGDETSFEQNFTALSPSDDGTYLLPAQSGYIIEVSASWTGGSAYGRAHYCFYIG